VTIDRRMVLIASAGLIAPTAWAAPRGLNGAWTGVWVYSMDKAAFRDPDTRFPFSITLRENGATFSGRTDEPNTFADPAYKRLAANVVGARKARAITFIKTYATGEVRHSVDYRGAANRDWSQVEGVWSIGSVTGLWRMTRAASAAIS
jgi:hypothetical protein